MQLVVNWLIKIDIHPCILPSTNNFLDLIKPGDKPVVSYSLKNQVMKKIIVLCLAMATLATTHAQKKRLHEGNRDQLLVEKLKFTDEQREKAKRMNEEFRKNMTELRKKDDITVKEWKSQMSALNKKRHEDMRNLLSKEQKMQMEKLKTDKRKIAGINANARMEKMKLRLDLNDEQVAKLKKQRSEITEKMKGLHENKSMDMMKKREEMKMLMKERKENMRSILTEEQMKKMQEMRKSTHKKRRVLS
jgi:hypothetical protein